jgi:hypothetical protein
VADRDIDVYAKTVGELRKVMVWPENLVITTPQERYSESAIRVSKATHATRVTPKSQAFRSWKGKSLDRMSRLLS